MMNFGANVFFQYYQTVKSTRILLYQYLDGVKLNRKKAHEFRSWASLVVL